MGPKINQRAVMVEHALGTIARDPSGVQDTHAASPMSTAFPDT